MPAPIQFADPDYIVESYKSGRSRDEIARELGVTSYPIRRILKEAGIPLRSRSEAKRADWIRFKQAHRSVTARMSPMWEAKRRCGTSRNEVVRRAQSMIGYVRRGERFVTEIAAMISESGIQATINFPILTYSVDIALQERLVAVEVQYSNHTNPASSLRRERLEDILDAGWSVLVVYARYRVDANVAAIAKQTITFADRVRGTPTTGGQYGVISGEAEPMTPRRLNLPRRPRVDGF